MPVWAPAPSCIMGSALVCMANMQMQTPTLNLTHSPSPPPPSSLQSHAEAIMSSV